MLLGTLLSENGSILQTIAYSYLYDNYGKIHIMLSNGTEFTISEALYSLSCQKMLLRFKDIRTNNYHVETTEKKGVECLCKTSNLYYQKHTLDVSQMVSKRPQLNGLSQITYLARS